MTPLLAGKPRSDRVFERMYEKHVGDVYRYALVVLRNPDDAEDVTQTTFMNAYRAFRGGERPRRPQNWLIAIAHNVCRQRFRQSMRRPSILPLEEELAEAQMPDEDAPSAEDIRRALGHLAFNQRAALVMRELEGRSYPEIGQVLGITTSAVETLIFRARRALREQLEGTLTCHEAEFAISRQLDRRIGRREKSQLRAHLRECPDCSRFARSQRAQRSAIKSLAMIPLPTSLAQFVGGGAAVTAGGAGAGIGSVLGGVSAKVAAVGASAVVATGVGVEAGRKAGWHPLVKKTSVAAAATHKAGAPRPQQRASVSATARVKPVLQRSVVRTVKRSHRGGAFRRHQARHRSRRTRQEIATPTSDLGRHGKDFPLNPEPRAWKKRGITQPRRPHRSSNIRSRGRGHDDDMGGRQELKPKKHARK
ncbi:MAG: sigma-70 family RNA polymerase sigma factor [Actinomycetota bacterium]|nr:sigma-70 family RNA polymerase sigma factor [Actinomycetota bacterium]